MELSNVLNEICVCVCVCVCVHMHVYLPAQVSDM